jgi:hypothetical protein
LPAEDRGYVCFQSETLVFLVKSAMGKVMIQAATRLSAQGLYGASRVSPAGDQSEG